MNVIMTGGDSKIPRVLDIPQRPKNIPLGWEDFEWLTPEQQQKLSKTKSGRLKLRLYQLDIADMRNGVAGPNAQSSDTETENDDNNDDDDNNEKESKMEKKKGGTKRKRKGSDKSKPKVKFHKSGARRQLPSAKAGLNCDDNGQVIPTVDSIIGTSPISTKEWKVKAILRISFVTVSPSMKDRKDKHVPSISSSFIQRDDHLPEYKDKIQLTGGHFMAAVLWDDWSSTHGIRKSYPMYLLSPSNLRSIRERYKDITKQELNADVNLWHQNGMSLEPIMTLNDEHIPGAIIADYIAKYRDRITVYCSKCQAEPNVVCSNCHRAWCPICYTKVEMGDDNMRMRPIVPPQAHVDWTCPECKSNRCSKLSKNIRLLNKNTAIVTLSFHNKADDSFFTTVRDLHARNPISGLMNNIGAYWAVFKDLESKDIPNIVDKVWEHYYEWETMDQLIVEIQVHSMNGLGGFADAKLNTFDIRDVTSLMNQFTTTFRDEIWNNPALPIHFILTSCETMIGNFKDIICQPGVDLLTYNKAVGHFSSAVFQSDIIIYLCQCDVTMEDAVRKYISDGSNESLAPVLYKEHGIVNEWIRRSQTIIFKWRAPELDDIAPPSSSSSSSSTAPAATSINPTAAAGSSTFTAVTAVAGAATTASRTLAAARLTFAADAASSLSTSSTTINPQLAPVVGAADAPPPQSPASCKCGANGKWKWNKGKWYQHCSINDKQKISSCRRPRLPILNSLPSHPHPRVNMN